MSKPTLRDLIWLSRAMGGASAEAIAAQSNLRPTPEYVRERIQLAWVDLMRYRLARPLERKARSIHASEDVFP